MANPVVHWEIGGRDLDALGAFYRDVFDGEPSTFDSAVDATLAKAKDRDRTPLPPPTPIPGVGVFALFPDPEGNAIGIMRPDTAS